MKKRRIFRYIAISLIIAIAVDTIPIYALPIAQEAKEQTELLMPEGVPLPTESPVLEELENDGGIPEDELLASLPPMDETETCESPILEEAQEKREENTKHFLTADHTYLAAIYPSAVHYQEDGVWKDIDNTLRLQRDSEGDAYYENTASNTHVRFAQSAEDETVVSIEKDGLALSWGLAPADENGVENSSEEAQAEEIVEESTDQADSEFIEELTEEVADGSEDEKVAIEENVDSSADEEAVNEAEELPASTFHVIQKPRKAQVRAAVQEEFPETEEEIQAYNENYTQLPQLTSAGYYPDILPGIDLSYNQGRTKLVCWK